MAAAEAFLEGPEHLFAAHERLRSQDFPLVSLISAENTLDARVWVGRWARSRGRLVVASPSVGAKSAIASYRARLPKDAFSPTSARVAPLPVLLLIGDFQKTFEIALEIAREHPCIPLAMPCGMASVVESLLDPTFSQQSVGAALQGLIPVGDTSRQVLKSVADARQAPFFRGACEGLLFYMLEARGQTRGRFAPNARLPNTAGNRRHEVDLFCEGAKLVIEIDGHEHNQPARKIMDAKKQDDLARQGFRVRRFSNRTVMDDPVGVWRDIASFMQP